MRTAQGPGRSEGRGQSDGNLLRGRIRAHGRGQGLFPTRDGSGTANGLIGDGHNVGLSQLGHRLDQGWGRKRRQMRIRMRHNQRRPSTALTRGRIIHEPGELGRGAKTRVGRIATASGSSAWGGCSGRGHGVVVDACRPVEPGEPVDDA